MRKTKRALTLLGVFVVLWLTVVVLNGFLAGTNACSLALALEPGRAPFPLWCLEFWIFRYQSLIGAFATLAAGAFAFWAVQRQTEAGRVTDRRMELAAIETMLSHKGWAKELADLIDYTSFSRYSLYFNGSLEEERKKIIDKQEQFFSERPRILLDDQTRRAIAELEVAAGQAHVEAVMVRHAYVCENIVHAKDDVFDDFNFLRNKLVLSKPEKDRLVGAMDDLCKHLSARAQSLTRAIQRIDRL